MYFFLTVGILISGERTASELHRVLLYFCNENKIESDLLLFTLMTYGHIMLIIIIIKVNNVLVLFFSMNILLAVCR